MTRDYQSDESDAEGEDIVPKTIKLPRGMWESIEERIRTEDTDFSKWARNAFRNYLKEAATNGN